MPAYSYKYNGIVEQVNQSADGTVFLEVGKIADSTTGEAVEGLPADTVVIKQVVTDSYSESICDSVVPGDFVLFPGGKLEALVSAPTTSVKKTGESSILFINLENLPANKRPFFFAGLDQSKEYPSKFVQACFNKAYYPSFTEGKAMAIVEFISNMFGGRGSSSIGGGDKKKASDYFRWKVARDISQPHSGYANVKFVNNINYLCGLYLRYKLSDSVDINKVVSFIFNDKFTFELKREKKIKEMVKFKAKQNPGLLPPVLPLVCDKFLETVSHMSKGISGKFPLISNEQVEILLVKWFQVSVVRCFNLLGITRSELKSIFTDDLFLGGCGLAMANDRGSSIDLCDFCKADIENETFESRHLVNYQLVDWCGLCARGDTSGEYAPPLAMLFAGIPQSQIGKDLGITLGSSVSSTDVKNIFQYTLQCILKNPFAFRGIPQDKATSIFLATHPIAFAKRPDFKVLQNCAQLVAKLGSTDNKNAAIDLGMAGGEGPAFASMRRFIKDNEGILTRVFGVKVIVTTKTGDVGPKVYNYERHMVEQGLKIFFDQAVKQTTGDGDSALAPRKSFNSILYSEEQNAVIDKAVKLASDTNSGGVSIAAVTGGPGVGKSTILKEILKQLKAKEVNVRLSSFTGKAVARIKELTDCQDDAQISTMDRIIAKKDLLFDYLIIDEASMVSSDLMFKLLLQREVAIFNEASMTTKSYGTFINKQHKCNYLMKRLLTKKRPFSPLKLLLIGDKDQLPPIQWGCVFSDILREPTSVYPKVQVSRLTRNFRTGDTVGLIDFFTALNTRTLGELDVGELVEGGTVRLKSNVSSSLWAHTAIEEIKFLCKQFEIEATKFPEFIGVSCAYNVHVSAMNDVIRKYYFSVLSSKGGGEMSKRNTEKSGRFMEGDRIMLIQNVYYYEETGDGTSILRTFSNGDMGYVTTVSKNEAPVFTVTFDSCKAVPVLFSKTKSNYKQDDESATASENGANIIPSDFLVHGYALTVHKMQGSEYNHVIFMTPRPSTKSADFLVKSLAYTAVTRAKKTVTLVCEKDCMDVLGSYQ